MTYNSAPRKNSTTYASTNWIGNVREDFDEENADCEVFMHQQKALDTLDYDVLLAKRNHYEIGSV